MTRYRSDIPYGYDDVSHVGYWTPDTPEFLEKREERRAAQRSSATSYTQAKANIRRVSIQNQAMSESSARVGDNAPIIDFEQLDRGRYGYESDGRRSSGSMRFTASRGNTRVRAEVSRERVGSSRGHRQSGYRFSAEISADRFDGSSRRETRGNAYRAESRRASSRGQAYADRRYRDDSGYPDEQAFEDEPPSSLRDRLRKARRDIRARKADRAFSRDYAETSAPLDEGPRAAVYEGRMGRQHQRAQRMQSAERSSGFQMPAFISGIISALPLDRLAFHPLLMRMTAALACMVFVVCGIYPAAQGYYLQTRANDQMMAEYQAVLDRNAELEQHVATLQTDEGMEELAHESLGWVHEGENSVSVITDGSADPGSGSLGNVDAIPEGSVPTPETWYSPVLDVVFGYEG